MAEQRGGGSGGSASITHGGITFGVVEGWEARIRVSSSSDPGGVTKPVLHVSTVPLIPERGDYGSGVVEALGSDDLFMALIEFGEEAVGSELFPETDEIPMPEPDWFHPRQLQRVIPGQGGAQRFFTLEGRAFCLYVVLGSMARRVELAGLAAQVLGDLQLDPV